VGFLSFHDCINQYFIINIHLSVYVSSYLSSTYYPSVQILLVLSLENHD
jgi:hypothetical protein